MREAFPKTVVIFVLVLFSQVSTSQAQLLSNGRPAHWDGYYDHNVCRMIYEQWQDWLKDRDSLSDQTLVKQANDYAQDKINEYNYKCKGL